MDGNIEKYATLIDNPGRAHIQKVLRTHSNPAQALVELQQTLGFKYSANIALPFLDLLEVPRASVYQSLFECTKMKLEELLQNLPEDMLLNILSATFRFITVKDLKSTPMSIIKRLRKIPEKYLKALASKKLQGILEEIPISVRRQVWRVDSSHFLQTVMEYSSQWIKSAKDEGNLRPDHSVASICDLIGDSKYLFSKFAQLCTQHVFTEEKEILWATLLRHTVMGIMKEKIPALAKLRDFSLQIDQAIRESSIGAIVVRNLVNYLKDIRRAADVIQIGLSSNTALPTNTNASRTLPPSAPPSRTKRPMISELTLQLKEFVNNLRERKEYKIFMTPAVDQLVEREAKEMYLKTIQTPMDLTKINKQINKYESVEAFESDLLLMLDNCRSFNGPGLLSDIADECWKIWSQLKDSQGKSKRARTAPKLEDSLTVPTPRPPPFTAAIAASAAKISPPSAAQVAATADIPATTAATVLSSAVATPSLTSNKPYPVPVAVPLKKTTKPHVTVEEKSLPLIDKLNNAWTFVNSLDANHLFAAPVMEQYPEIAQEYRKIVSTPMDLRTIKGKLSSYRTFKEFDEDVCLMYRNAENFNKYDKFLLPIVRGMSNKWKKERASYATGKHLTGVAEPVKMIELSPIPEEDKSEVNSMVTNLRDSINSALDFFSRIEEANAFAAPVTVPGYTNIIRDPRDLHSIRVNSSKYRNLDQFESDLQLMFQNCIQFNHHTGDKFYVKLAIQLWNLWKENRKAVLLGHPLPASATILSTSSSHNMDQQELMELADNDSDDEEDEEDDWGRDREEMEEKTKKRKGKPKTDIPTTAGTGAGAVRQSVTAAGAKNKTATPKTKNPSSSNSTKDKAKSKSTFVKPLPLHIQTLGPLNRSSSASSASSSALTKSAPSIESLLASMAPSSSSSSREHSNGFSSSLTSSSSPPDTFSIEILSWAAVILRDSQLQSLCHQFLISLLYQLYERSALPNDDETFQNVLLLCQFSLSSDCQFREINPTLLRKILPLVMLLTIREGEGEGEKEGDDQEIDSLMRVYGEEETGESYLEFSLIRAFVVKTLSSFRGKFHQTNLALSAMKSDTSMILGRVSGVED